MNINFSTILEDFESFVTKEIQRNHLWAEMTVFITTTLESIYSDNLDGNFHKTLKINITKRNKKFLRTLAIMSYYCDTNLGWLLRTEIGEIIENQIVYSDIRFILKSKTNMILYLQSYFGTKTARQIYGNILNKHDSCSYWKTCLNFVRVKTQRNYKSHHDIVPEKRTIGVGYKDKGHLPKSDSPGTQCFSDLKLQNEIEYNRQLSEDFDKIVEGLLW